MYFKNNDIIIYYEKHGNSKKTILILPGWGYTRNTFISMINYFKNDYSIYILDYPSFGNSPIPNKELTIYDYSNLIKEFIIKNNIINPIIIAHSFGGRISSILLSKYKIQIDKLILIDVAGIKRIKLKLLIKQTIYKLLKYISIILPKYKRYKYRKNLLKIFGSTDYNNIPIIMKKTFKNIIKVDLSKYYKTISSDTLIIWGEKDKDTPLKDAKYLKKVIKNSTIITYKKANHFSYLTYPNLTNEIINNFINKES